MRKKLGNWYWGVLLLIILVVQSTIVAISQAAPYFRFEPGKEVVPMAAFKIGTPVDNVSWGSKTHLFKHHAEDGYVFFPGIGWSLMDVGFVKPFHGGRYAAVLGPSLDLSEPIKALAMWALTKAYPTQDAFSIVKQIMKPNDPAAKWQITTSAGPAFQEDLGDLQHISQLRGALIWEAGLACKF